MNKDLLAKALEAYEKINAKKIEEANLRKAMKNSASRSGKGNFVVFKTESNNLGVIIPSNVKINGLNRFALKNNELLNDFKNSDEKTLKI